MVLVKILTGTLRRRRTSIYFISSIFSPYFHLGGCGAEASTGHLSSSANASLFAHHLYVRSLSTTSSAASKFLNQDSCDPAAQSGFSNLDLNDVDGGGDQSGIVEKIVSAAAAAGGEVEERILPIRVLVSLLDSYHDLTSFPWWIVIASSTLALRIAYIAPYSYVAIQQD